MFINPLLTPCCIYGIIVSTWIGGILLKTTIKRWGNSAAVRIPRQVLAQANLEEGSDVEVLMTGDGEITLRAAHKRKSIQELFANYDGGFFQTEEIDWGPPKGDEAW